jgi:Zn finger protein HypA/HybF involved in hydrogenase expression
MASITLHDLALSSYPVGIECSHCMRHVLLTAERTSAKFGNKRTLEEAGLYCSKCGSRAFTAVRFEKRSRMIAFMRNL